MTNNNPRPQVGPDPAFVPRPFRIVVGGHAYNITTTKDTIIKMIMRGAIESATYVGGDEVES